MASSGRHCPVKVYLNFNEMRLLELSAFFGFPYPLRQGEENHIEEFNLIIGPYPGHVKWNFQGFRFRKTLMPAVRHHQRMKIPLARLGLFSGQNLG